VTAHAFHEARRDISHKSIIGMVRMPGNDSAATDVDISRCVHHTGRFGTTRLATSTCKVSPF
jgi:hypothetical protein